MTGRTRAVAAAGGATLGLLLAGCGAGGEPAPEQSPPSTSVTPTSSPTPSPRSSPTPSPSRTPGTSPAPRPAAGTGPRVVDPGPRSLLELTDVRVGHHDGFDRVVLELRGPGRPGWSVRYVDRPRGDGSGELVPVAGDSFLDVYASGTTYDPDDLAYDVEDRRHVPVPGGGPVRDVYVLGTFEGYTQVIVGVDGPAVPYRVSRLADPPRVVVDLRDGAGG